MHELFKTFTEVVALGLETIASILIAIGGVGVIYRLFRGRFKESTNPPPLLREAWLGFARWILLGLEFTMGADIVRTAIAPTWDSIGQLAAIAVIRTFLSFFLERDLELEHKGQIQKEIV